LIRKGPDGPFRGSESQHGRLHGVISRRAAGRFPAAGSQRRNTGSSSTASGLLARPSSTSSEKRISRAGSTRRARRWLLSPPWLARPSARPRAASRASRGRGPAAGAPAHRRVDASRTASRALPPRTG